MGKKKRNKGRIKGSKRNNLLLRGEGQRSKGGGETRRVVCSEESEFPAASRASKDLWGGRQEHQRGKKKETGCAKEELGV